jgi:hypothetical protein
MIFEALPPITLVQFLGCVGVFGLILALQPWKQFSKDKD